MTGQGHRIFADELGRFAAGHADPRVRAIAQRCAAPLRVAVRGRRGVGRGTVARALDLAGDAYGISVTTGAVDVVVYVIAEAVKPEDVDAVAGAGSPVVAVLNKADLARLSGRADDARLAALIGAPMVSMSALLAVAAAYGLDAALWAALRALAADPGGATCLDGSFAGFLAADIPVAPDVRQRLLETLDLFGTALGIAAARRGGTPAQVRTLLRRVSGVDAVVNRISVAGAEARYRRVLLAVAELEALAVGDEGVHRFLSCDDTVLARMAAAVDVAAAAGLDPGADSVAQLPRAVRWQRYGRGPVGELHRACGADIARGSLRLWSRAGGSPPGGSD